MSKTMSAIYWIATTAIAALVGALAAGWSIDQAPTFSDDKGAAATSASHLLYGIIGGLVGFFLVMAVAAAIWMVGWVRHRRATYVDDYDDYDHDVDLLEDADDGQDADEQDDDEQDDDEQDVEEQLTDDEQVGR